MSDAVALLLDPPLEAVESAGTRAIRPLRARWRESCAGAAVHLLVAATVFKNSLVIGLFPVLIAADPCSAFLALRLIFIFFWVKMKQT